ncbi:GNAT family N-acetyltransferase [Nakamurella antarctica]|uniref:GNAT family N-acetyltransferase n=1 Tax=Nakamurella antarctica TaxID=1902245 RepID=UPI0019CF73AA|nr:GNAT family N-acetyltransferase [Nakamurella antarctica]
MGPQHSGKVAGTGHADFEKEVWLSGMMLTWGSCGQLLTVDDEVAGFAIFAPPSAVPTTTAFPTAPVSSDAVLLMTAKVLPQFAGQGHARYLIQGVAKHLAGRGVRAIEVFGYRPDAGDLANTAGDLANTAGDLANTAGDLTTDASDDAIPPCLIPAEFALGLGFTEIRPHHRYPRLRMELDSAISWKADVEAAIEQLFSVITIPASPRPSAALVGNRAAIPPRGYESPVRDCS